MGRQGFGTTFIFKKHHMLVVKISQASLHSGSFLCGSSYHCRLSFVADSPQRLQSEERGHRGQEGEAVRRCARPPWLIELPK